MRHRETALRKRRPCVAAGLLALAAAASAVSALAQAPPAFEVQEASIAGIHEAMRAGRLSCRALVEQYLRRIDTFDKNGPALNAIVVTNPDALRLADELHRRFAAGGLVGPLHCVPMIVKDNFEIIGLQCANGSPV
ncbi:MAG: amidase family protein, partial [Vicinamibacterales bacterium]